MATAVEKTPTNPASNERKPVLLGHHLTQVYGDGEERQVVLDDVSIELFPGELTLLMGPAGDRKSVV